MITPQALLSTAWVAVTFNYLYCDILGLMDPTLLKQFLSGTIGTIVLTQNFLLGASVLMEIPIAMIFLSRILPYTYNRWANITAGVLMTLVQGGSLFFGTSVTSYYAFFSLVEISGTIAITWFAWRWSQPKTVQSG